MLLKLETERFVLSTLNEEFSESVFDYYSRNAIFFQKYSPLWPKDFLKIDNIEKMLMKQHYLKTKKISYHFYIYHKTDKKSRYILGDISYTIYDINSTNSCLLGYQTDKRVTCKGVATESLRVSNNYILNCIGLNRIEALVMPTNLPSIRVLDKLGFEYNLLQNKLF